MATIRHVEDAWKVTLPPRLEILVSSSFDSCRGGQGELIRLPAPALTLDRMLAARKTANDWDIPAGLVPIIGDFHELVCLDYRKSRMPAVVLLDDRRTETRLFDSFDEFVKNLCESPGSSDTSGIVDDESFLDF